MKLDGYQLISEAVTRKDYKVYDKVKWHLEGSKPAPSLESAFEHFKVIMEFLKSKQMLSQYGLRIWNDTKGPDPDFIIDSDMVNPKGRSFMDRFYDKWLEQVLYDKLSSTIPIGNNSRNSHRLVLKRH